MIQNKQKVFLLELSALRRKLLLLKRGTYRTQIDIIYFNFFRSFPSLPPPLNYQYLLQLNTNLINFVLRRFCLINFNQSDQKTSEFLIRSEQYLNLLQIKIEEMKQESIEVKLNPEAVPIVQHHPVMTEQFVRIYQEALAYSNVHKDELRFRNVNIYQNDHMHQVYTVSRQNLPHLVLLHGYGGTSLTYVKMFDKLKPHFQVHALDTFGIGLSSRGNWNNQMTTEQTCNYYIQALEEWRKSVGLNSFVLAGHSFGGYISTLYFERYPERVKHLLLLSPAGTHRFTEEQIEQRASKSKFFFCVAEKVYNMNIRPSKAMDTFWIGNKFIDRILQNRLKLPQDQQSIWKKYLKHISGQKDSSQQGFYNIFQWPLQPARSIEMILQDIRPKTKIDFFYGDVDWMQPAGALRLKAIFKNINVHHIDNAGHQMLFDNPQQVAYSMIRAYKAN